MGKISKISFKPHFQKIKSTFFSKELIYDYLNKQLSEDKVELLESALKENFSVRIEVKRVQNAQNYLTTLRHIDVPSTLVEKIEPTEDKGFMTTRKLELESLPEGVRQALMALGVVSVIVLIAILVPWHKIRNMNLLTSHREVVIVQVEKNQNVSDLSEMEKNEEPLFADDQTVQDAKLEITPAKDSAKSLVAQNPAAKVVPEKTAPTALPTVQPTEPTMPLVAVKPEAKTQIPTPPPAGNVPETGETVANAGTATNVDTAVGTGFLYRGQMKITNLEVNGKRLTDKILELGGRKAGEVDLGWKRGPTTLYYHFTIPQARYAELQTFLELYGKPLINKEKHPRVMPDGIIRLILTVDEETK